MNPILLACLLAGAQMGECRAEMDFPPPVFIVLPDWATPQWQDFAAHIVASEARNVPTADIVIACTLVRDVERGWHPWMLRGRWFGWSTPDEKDREAVLQAVNGGCVEVPNYKYVGNFRDSQHWAATGMIYEGPHDLYLGPTGSSVVGIRW